MGVDKCPGGIAFSQLEADCGSTCGDDVIRQRERLDMLFTAHFCWTEPDLQSRPTPVGLGGCLRICFQRHIRKLRVRL